MMTPQSADRLQTCVVLAVLVLMAGPAFPTTFTVTNTSDTGAGSLRWAIESANGNPGADLIAFNIPGTGPHTIMPHNPLPVITDPVTIDGYTQLGANPATTDGPATLLIELDGTEVGELHWDSGLIIAAGAGGSTVRGLVINRFGDAGIHIGDEVGGNTIEGNYIGTDATGTLDVGNYDDGVRIWNTPNNRIGGTEPAARNVISGSNDNGVEILLPGAVGNRVEGNYIGVDATGTGPLGNPNDGVHIKEGAGYNTIGPGNVISGNYGSGIEITGNDVTGNQVLGNLIGTDVTGTAALGNGDAGVRLWQSPGNTVGGTEPGSGNVISGNSWVGVEMGRAGATGNTVEGNYIGTDVTGTAALGNGGDGVHIWNAPANTIGGISEEARNVMSGNGDNGVGIFDDGATGNLVQGNYIGVDTTGEEALGNTGSGIHIGNAHDNIIGGSSPEERNIISNNVIGIAMQHCAGNAIMGNYIGTNARGDAPMGNTNEGIGLGTGCTANSIGGTREGEGNVISDNITGILVSAGGSSDPSDWVEYNIIQGNIVGTEPVLGIGFGNGDGIIIADYSWDNWVGGREPGAGNMIAGNQRFGVCVNDGQTGNSILSNSIYLNGSLGINLGEDDVTANDEGDVDTGPNNLMNFPVLRSAMATPGQLIVTGTIDTPDLMSVRLEFFANSVPDESDHGEGEIYLGAAKPNATGAFTAAVPPVSLGMWISATATDGDGNTSEFALSIEVTELGKP